MAFADIDFVRQPRQKVMDKAQFDAYQVLTKAGNHNDVGGGCTKNLNPDNMFPDNTINILPIRRGDPFTLFCKTPEHLLNVDHYCKQHANLSLNCHIKNDDNDWRYWGDMQIYARGAIRGADWRQLSPTEQQQVKKMISAKAKMNSKLAGAETDRSADEKAARQRELLAENEQELERIGPAAEGREKLKTKIRDKWWDLAKLEGKGTKANPLKGWGFVGNGKARPKDKPDMDHFIRQLDDPSTTIASLSTTPSSAALAFRRRR